MKAEGTRSVQTVRSAYRRGRPQKKRGGGGWRGIANLWQQQQKALASARSSLFSFSFPLSQGPHGMLRERADWQTQPGTQGQRPEDQPRTAPSKKGAASRGLTPPANRKETGICAGRPLPPPFLSWGENQNRRKQPERPAPTCTNPGCAWSFPCGTALRPSVRQVPSPSHFTGTETETQRGKVPSLRSHNP